MTTSPPSNPFLAPSPLPFELPDFGAVRVEHFREAFEIGMAEQAVELEVIADSADPPTLENTVVALERSGRTLDRASRVFSLLTSADTTAELEAIEVEYAPASRPSPTSGCSTAGCSRGSTRSTAAAAPAGWTPRASGSWSATTRTSSVPAPPSARTSRPG